MQRKRAQTAAPPHRSPGAAGGSASPALRARWAPSHLPPSLPPSFPASLLPSLRVGKPGHPTRPPAAPEPRRQLPGPQQGGPGLPAHTGRSSPGTAAPAARGGPRAAPASEAPEDLLRNAPALKGVCFMVCCRLCRYTQRWCRTGDLKTCKMTDLPLGCFALPELRKVGLTVRTILPRQTSFNYTYY